MPWPTNETSRQCPGHHSGTERSELEPTAPYRELTHRPGLVPVPVQWIHTTVMHGGPVDQYTDSEITTIVDRVGEACATIAPVDLIYDRPSVGTVAVECAARPVRRPAACVT